MLSHVGWAPRAVGRPRWRLGPVTRMVAAEPATPPPRRGPPRAGRVDEQPAPPISGPRRRPDPEHEMEAAEVPALQLGGSAIAGRRTRRRPVNDSPIDHDKSAPEDHHRTSEARRSRDDRPDQREPEGDRQPRRPSHAAFVAGMPNAITRSRSATPRACTRSIQARGVHGERTGWTYARTRPVWRRSPPGKQRVAAIRDKHARVTDRAKSDGLVRRGRVKGGARGQQGATRRPRTSSAITGPRQEQERVLLGGEVGTGRSDERPATRAPRSDRTADREDHHPWRSSGGLQLRQQRRERGDLSAGPTRATAQATRTSWAQDAGPRQHARAGHVGYTVAFRVPSGRRGSRRERADEPRLRRRRASTDCPVE